MHFPIAFATAAVAFIAVGTAFRNWSYAAQCLITGRWMLWGAALFSLEDWDVWRGRSGKMPSQGFLVLLVAAWLLVIVGFINKNASV